MREVAIEGDGIRLGQLLKLAGLVESGGAVKSALATGDVLVNGTSDDRRGRQLQRGDVIAYAGDEVVLA